MLPLEKQDRRLGRGKRISKKKNLQTHHDKKNCSRRKKRLPPQGLRENFHRPPKNPTQPLYFPNGLSLITPHVTESGICEKFACGIRNPGFWSPEYSSKNPDSH